MTKFYVGITDINWVSVIRDEYNKGKLKNKQVIFWQRPTRKFEALKQGELFLFKHHNKKETEENGEIVGGGYFVRYKQLSITDAWNKYDRRNGFESEEKMCEGVKDKEDNGTIGCIILEKVFFIDSDDWINEPEDWKSTNQKGKTYTTDDKIGKALYDQVQAAIKSESDSKTIIEAIEKEIAKPDLSGKEKDAIVKRRVNQNVFRERLLKKYDKCCICKVENQSLLIASHIKPWTKSEPGEKLDLQNGFLLCPNHDALFDGGYITFDNNGQICISNRLSKMDRIFMNVNDETKMNIKLSEGNKKYLEYHRKNVYKES